MNDKNIDAAPFISAPCSIEDNWIDYNGHLNMAYYLVMFERAFDDFHFALGTGIDYVKQRQMTLYTGQVKVDYLKEIHISDPLTHRCQLIDFDEKRMHTWQELIHENGDVAATCETLTLHIDMTGPKVTPFPDDIVATISHVFEQHRTLQRPLKAGHGIGIKAKSKP